MSKYTKIKEESLSKKQNNNKHQPTRYLKNYSKCY